MTLELLPGEKVRFEVLAELVAGHEYISGRLSVTDERVFFRPHALFATMPPFAVPIKQIADVAKHNRLWVLPVGLTIRTLTGEVYTFVTGKRAQIIAQIRTLMK